MSARAGAGAGVEPDLEFLLEPEWSQVKSLTGSATLLKVHPYPLSPNLGLWTRLEVPDCVFAS